MHVLIGEWIPLGANAMMMLNDTRGASERVQGGFFSKDFDENPEETVWQGNADGLTAVNILDWDETGYVNYIDYCTLRKQELLVIVKVRTYACLKHFITENAQVRKSQHGLMTTSTLTQARSSA